MSCCRHRTRPSGYAERTRIGDGQSTAPTDIGRESTPSRRVAESPSRNEDSMTTSIPIADQTVRPSRIEIPQRDLDDLRSRLERTRWSHELIGVGSDYGVPVAYVRRLIDYWLDGYDWRAWENRLNQCAPSETVIDGQRVHFLHVRSSEPEAIPLIMTHGCPGSIVEFLDVIEPLTDPASHGRDPSDAFH